MTMLRPTGKARWSRRRIGLRLLVLACVLFALAIALGRLHPAGALAVVSLGVAVVFLALAVAPGHVLEALIPANPRDRW